MKKALALTILNMCLFLNVDVFACGEITDLTSNIGTIKQTNTTNYVITIPEGIKTVKLGAKTDYDWVEGYGPREVSTSEKVELKVDGNKCGYGIYTYFVTFKEFSNLIAENTTVDEPNNNTDDTSKPESTPESDITNEQTLKLSSLTVEGFELNFEPSTYSYTLDVNSDVVSLNIEATPEVASNTVNISENAKELVEGVNNILITIVNSEGQTSTYTLVVNRAKVLSNNNYLASLVVNGYVLNFDPSQTTYTIELQDDTYLDISAITESELSVYEIKNNNNLKDGSSVTITVTAEDGSTRDYIINVTKSFNIMDYWIYIVVAGLTVLLIILLIINKKRKNRKKMEPESVETQNETAGVIPETISQSTETPIESFSESSIVSPISNETLQIIEPTDIEVSTTVNNEQLVDNSMSSQQDIENNSTEVFKL